MVSCSSAYGNNGCGGGWYYYAWDYAVVTPLDTDAQYPYTNAFSGVTNTCIYAAGSGAYYDQTQTDVAANTSAIMNAISQQPVAVAIEADNSIFKSYLNGIITSAACGTNIDHAVTAVGYGV